MVVLVRLVVAAVSFAVGLAPLMAVPATAVAKAQAGDHAYVANLNSNTVSVIETCHRHHPRWAQSRFCGATDQDRLPSGEISISAFSNYSYAATAEG
jgi:hypothetical protein